MATVVKDFRLKAGLVVEGSTATVEGHNVLTNKIADAKGDLLVGTADNAISRVAVGTNGQVLTAASGEASGLIWAAPAAVGVFGSSIEFEGATANEFETTLAVTDPTADRTITLPDATGTVALTSDIPSISGMVTESGTQTLTNKTLTSPKINEDVIITATSTEINILDGVTSTASELNLLDGVTATTTELNYVDGVTSAIQTQLDAKATSGDLTTHTGATEAHGATGAVVGTTNTQTITNKTLTSPKINEDVVLTSTATELNILDGVTATTAELNFVDGVTSAIQTQIDDKAPSASPAFTGTVTGITSTMVGLANVDNTSDASKPVSTATQAALDDKAPLASPSLTGTPLAVTASPGTNNTQIATTAYADAAVAALVDGAPALLDTLNELAAAINDDASFATTLTTSVGEKVAKSGDTMTGLLVLSADPAANLGAATKQYVDTAESDANTTASGYVSAHSDLTTGVHGVTGSVVGTTDTQSLTNKTIDGASNTLTVRIANDVSGLGTNVATFLATPSSTNLASAVTDETGSGALVFANTPTLVTPEIGAATGTTLVLSSALTSTAITLNDSSVGSATATAGTSATTIDTFSASTYSSAKYIVQMKLGTDIEVIEVLVTVDGNNNVYLTEYADVISNAQLGTTDAVYSGGNVLLQVTAASVDTVVKLHRTYIEA